MKISNEERREVVQWMRCIARLWQEKIPNGKLNDNENKEAITFDLMEHMGLDEESPVHEFYAHLADLIDRPTCRNVYDESKAGACESGFECSECGNVVEDGEGWLVNGTFNYCSECGAEVVTDDD